MEGTEFCEGLYPPAGLRYRGLFYGYAFWQDALAVFALVLAP